jgi:hypothetical protein
MTLFHPIVLAAALFSLGLPVYAGRYPVTGVQTFDYANGYNTFTDGSSLSSTGLVVGFAQVTDNTLQLANKSLSGNSTAYRVSNLDPGAAVQSLDATFTVKMAKSSASSQPGSGWSLNFGAVPAGGYGAGDLGFSMTGGLVLSFDTYANSVNDSPSVEVYCNNASVGSFPAAGLVETSAITAGTFTLTNPATGGTTATINFLASAATVQWW